MVDLLLGDRAQSAGALASCGQAAMSAGPWHPRSEMCEASTAGVASVISAVETSPTFLPASWACSSIVL